MDVTGVAGVVPAGGDPRPTSANPPSKSDRKGRTEDPGPRTAPSGGSDAPDAPDTAAREPDSGPAVAATTREALGTTFDYQIERLRATDDEAIEILKANLPLIGIVVTGGSVVVQTTVDLTTVITPFTVTGGLLLLASAGLAAVTYTASDLRGGLDIRAVDAVFAGERSEAREAAETTHPAADGSTGDESER